MTRHEASRIQTQSYTSHHFSVDIPIFLKQYILTNSLHCDLSCTETSGDVLRHAPSFLLLIPSIFLSCRFPFLFFSSLILLLIPSAFLISSFLFYDYRKRLHWSRLHASSLHATLSTYRKQSTVYRRPGTVVKRESSVFKAPLIALLLSIFFPSMTSELKLLKFRNSMVDPRFFN